MAIHVTCPRCKKPLTAPNDKAGSYANCPACHGRFWVPNDGPMDNAAAAEVAVIPLTVHGPKASAAPVAPAVPPAAQVSPRPTPVPQGVPAPQSIPVPQAVPMPQVGPLPQVGPAPQTVRAPQAPPQSSPQAAPTPARTAAARPAVPPTFVTAPAPQPAVPQPVAPTPPPAGHKTARFISAEAAQSTLKLAADGKLPELHLEEGKTPEKKAEGQSSMSPALLFALLGTSLTLSLAMLVMGGKPTAPTNGAKQAEARQVIEENYFGAGNIEGAARLEPYQELLREARRQYVRGDWQAERRLHLQVLNMLRAERPATPRGLTGSRARDKELEENLNILLNDR